MEIIVTTREDLQAIVEEAVANIVGRQEAPEPAESADTVDAAGAIEFLAANGLTMSINTLYKRRIYQDIPRHRIGRRLVFSKAELLAWIQRRIVSQETPHTNSALEIARSAHRQKK